MPVTTKTRFVRILMNNKSIRKLGQKARKSTIQKIIDDLDVEGILLPITFRDSYNDEDDLSVMDASIQDLDDIESGTYTDDELDILKNVLAPTKRGTETCVIDEECLKRIRAKRRELAAQPDTDIILAVGDGVDGDIGLEIVSNTYGRTPLHEAVGMRNLATVKQYILAKMYLEDKDNNGNTPFAMAYQEDFMAAVDLFYKHKQVHM